MVVLAQLVRASDCGSEGRGFEPHAPPEDTSHGKYLFLFIYRMTLQEYIEQHSSAEPAYLQQVSRLTHQQVVNPHMLSGHIEGRFLSMLSHAIRPKRILELGTFTGYSALCLAEGLTEDGRLDTIERNDEMETLIRRNFDAAPHGAKIQLHIGDAKTILPTLTEHYDIIFMDADKREYETYYELCLPLLATNGMLIADNTLWDGHVIDPAYDRDKQTMALRAFNQRVANDTRVEKIMLPIRDGITIIRHI